MDKVAIVGCGGSGKSHLARLLGARLDAPVTHLDAVHYDDEWNTLPADKFAAAQQELTAAPHWVIDGNYAATLPIRLSAADTVVFLDLPTASCLWGILQRRLRHGTGQHKALGVYDRITVGFIRYILRYRRTMRPRVLRLFEQHAGDAEIVVLRSRRAVRRFLDTIGSQERPAPSA